MEPSDILFKLLMGACMVIAGLAKYQASSMQKQIDSLNARLDVLQEEHEAELEENATLKTKLTNCPTQGCHWKPQPQLH